MATTSITATGFQTRLVSSFHGSCGSLTLGKDHATLAAGTRHIRVGKALRCQPKMKNANEGKGVFAPLVIFARNLIGTKRFNQLRGKAIALHSQVITEFCKAIGADGKQRQELIRLAKKNGEKLGFLA